MKVSNYIPASRLTSFSKIFGSNAN